MMADFKIGDVVRLKKDEPERLNLVLVKFDGQGAFGVSECGRRRTWAAFEDCELVHRPDPQADLKQAIREVLLSDEFMKAFTKKAFSTKLSAGLNYKPVSAADLAMWRMSEPTEHPIPGVNQPMKSSEPTEAQELAERTMKAIWQANDGGDQ